MPILKVLLKKLILILVLLTILIGIKSQSDCMIQFSYSGKISRTKTSDSLKITFLLPGTEVLMKYEKKETHYYRVQIDSKETGFNEEFYSHISSDFCNSSDYIIRNVFINNLKSYKIFILYGGKKRKMNIRISDIQFKVVDNKIKIFLPEITI